jgi:hypothetical protein
MTEPIDLGIRLAYDYVLYISNIVWIKWECNVWEYNLNTMGIQCDVNRYNLYDQQSDIIDFVWRC